MFRTINVWVNEKNYELPIDHLIPLWAFDLIDHRIFDTLDDVKYTCMALSRGTKAALERGLACPADTKNAIKHIESLPKY